MPRPTPLQHREYRNAIIAALREGRKNALQLIAVLRPIVSPEDAVRRCQRHFGDHPWTYQVEMGTREIFGDIIRNLRSEVIKIGRGQLATYELQPASKLR